ncbi:MAG: DUF1648 domain-containing protein [Acidobacteria bacterium]|nr:DUF1648 domain-containing protein [Acidobacteriota bacterium]
MRPRLFSWWDFLPLVAAMALLAFLQGMLPSLPDPVPTHFDAAGRANGWTPRAHLPWLLLGTPFFAWALLWVAGTVGARLEKDPLKARFHAFFPLRGLMPVGFCALMATLLAVPSRGLGVVRWGVGALLACLVLGVAILVRQMKGAMAGQPDAVHYRWGMVYHNPGDPRLWVEKRFGLGWTLNYARPAAWWLTGLFLLLPLGVGVFVLLNMPRP